jgi:hypothetical protein
LNVVGTYRMSRSCLFSGSRTLAKPYPLAMKSQTDRKKYVFSEKNVFLYCESKSNNNLLVT